MEETGINCAYDSMKDLLGNTSYNLRAMANGIFSLCSESEYDVLTNHAYRSVVTRCQSIRTQREILSLVITWHIGVIISSRFVMYHYQNKAQVTKCSSGCVA